MTSTRASVRAAGRAGPGWRQVNLEIRGLSEPLPAFLIRDRDELVRAVLTRAKTAKGRAYLSVGYAFLRIVDRLAIRCQVIEFEFALAGEAR